MNKTHIALAIAALMPAAAAMADVTVYGEIRGGYEYNKSYSSTINLDANGKLQGGSGSTTGLRASVSRVTKIWAMA